MHSGTSEPSLGLLLVGKRRELEMNDRQTPLLSAQVDLTSIDVEKQEGTAAQRHDGTIMTLEKGAIDSESTMVKSPSLSSSSTTASSSSYVQFHHDRHTSTKPEPPPLSLYPTGNCRPSTLLVFLALGIILCAKFLTKLRVLKAEEDREP